MLVLLVLLRFLNVLLVAMMVPLLLCVLLLALLLLRILPPRLHWLLLPMQNWLLQFSLLLSAQPRSTICGTGR